MKHQSLSKDVKFNNDAQKKMKRKKRSRMSMRSRRIIVRINKVLIIKQTVFELKKL